LVPGVSRPIAECAATSGEYPDVGMTNKEVTCPKAEQTYPLTQLSDFAYNFIKSHSDSLLTAQHKT
jgi:hypothetical protein